jgi:type VI secretion system protein ImpH
MARKTLAEQLNEEPYRFEFFQAVRLFEKLYPEKRAVGGSGLPGEEPLRFRSRVSFDFPSSEIQEIREIEDPATGEKRSEVLVNFMGMVGVSGVLPVHYTELAFDRIRHGDTALWAFLDIFTHRAVSLFFRAWNKYRFPVSYERGDDKFTGYLFDLAGLGTPGLRGRMGFDDETLLPYAGLIAQRPHSSKAIESIISDYFSTPAELRQFHGQWIALEPSDHTRLGRRNSVLGSNTIAGKNIWDQQSKFRVRMGPLTYVQFTDLLPNGSGNRKLRSILRFLVGDEFDLDIQLILLARQVPGTVLTTRALRRPMLGWTSFLKTRPFENADEQVILQGAG